MADAESETEGGSERGGGRAPPGRRGSAAHVAPLGPEQLRRVLAQVTRVQPPPPPTVLQEAAQQAAVQHAPGTDPPRLPRLLPPQQLEAICVKLTSGDTKGQKPTLLPATIRPQPAGQSLLPRSQLSLVGLGVQPVAPQGPVPTKRVKAVPALGSQDPMPMPSAASGLPTETPAMPGSAHLFPSGSRAGPAEKFKKTPKVKTRSGRISRPPKHKAKDYKFIRTEDLAAGRPSDSDDYSDLSAGDEEEQQAPRALFAEASCALQPRAFRCQACDKAYIGQGGLARHWRLNPGHGWQQPEEGYTEASPRDLAPPERGTPAPSRPEPRTLAVLRQRRAEAAQGSPQCVEDEEAMMLEPESSAAVDLRSGAAQPRACSQARLREVPAQPRACSQARLRESLQQCAPEDLVELVLPRLAQVATVYEFLLAKAKDGGTAQPCFPAVYREFEELHCRVSSMYQELLGRASPASGQPLDVRNPQVAESLGITGFLRKAEAHSDCTAAQHHSMERAGQRSEEARSWQGACEAAEQAPTAWRPRQAVLPMTCPECPAAHSRDQEIPGLSTPTAHLGCQLKESADSEARCASAGRVALGEACHGAALGAQLVEPQENVPDARPALGNPGVHSTLSPVGEAAGAEPGDPGARPMAPLPEELLPTDVMPVGCARRTGPDRSPLTTGHHASNLKQLLQGMEVDVGHGDLECVPVGDTVTLGITSGYPEVLPQGKEQIFIQTASGVLPSHARTTMSQGDAVLVTGTEGPGLHVGGLEGVPLGLGTALTVPAEPSQ
ncbi:zinc finger protein 839 isoform X6 [Octodon degus]|uniref:Zinc finger protein 839 isoform X6 n=1 Tax=Octodon degus TaxID=10160 RepID=A0A6P6DNC8_OCTDE|nr:zinc finger protein 839 isoform X6 [Octodon degus]